MKPLLIFYFICVTISSFAQQEVPQSVKTSFVKNYPEAKSVKWSKEKENWEASFRQNKTETSVVIDQVGKIIEVESEITLNELPVAVKNSFDKEFANAKIKEVAKIVSGSTVTYEIEAKKNKESTELIFDSDGKLIAKKPVHDKSEKK